MQPSDSWTYDPLCFRVTTIIISMKKKASQTPIKVLVIVGQTASGKSDLAIKLAKKFNGEIISADSRQVYRGLDIGTAKLSLRANGKELRAKSVRHYLIDVADPKRKFTVTQFKKLAEKAIQEISQKNKLPIICGGTGQYIDTLLYDLKIPKVKPNLKLRKKLESKTTIELFEELKKIDPKRAETIDRFNPRRLIRAIEIANQTGKSSYSEILKNLKIRPEYEILKLGLKINELELKKRIERRFLIWLKQGLLTEVRILIKKGVSEKRLREIGLEYPIVNSYLKGKIDKEQMIRESIRVIWKYSKRQKTWFKRDKNIIWLQNLKKATESVGKFLE